MIELIHVSRRYGDAWAVREASLDIAAGELVAVLGESGSGKTTLVKMINRLVEPSSGEVRVDGRDVRTQDAVALRRTIGYVIQSGGLLPHLTLGDNVAIVPRLVGWRERDVAARVDELLAMVGLPPDEYRERFPDQLSGGQRQRVGVARALAARPKILLLDEPFGALDAITRVALQREVRRIHGELGLTTVMITHDFVEALTMADRIAVMWNGELRQVGTPRELMTAPVDADVAALMEMARTQGQQLLDASTQPRGSAAPQPGSGAREP